MTKKPAAAERTPPKDAPGPAPALYEKADPIPVPEVIDGDQDANWGLWQQAVASQDAKKPVDDSFDNTQPMSLAELNGYAQPKPKP